MLGMGCGPLEPRFLTQPVQADEGDIGGEDEILAATFDVIAIDIHVVLHGGLALAHALNGNAQDRALSHALVEFHLVHGDGDEAAAGIVPAGGNPGDLIDPLEHVAAEEVTVVVEVFGENELVAFHVELSWISELQDRLYFIRESGWAYGRATECASGDGNNIAAITG